MEAEMQKMQRELEEAKSAVTILELSKQDEIESVSRQYTQELASMQSIMKGRRLVQLTHLEIQVSDYVPRKVHDQHQVKAHSQLAFAFAFTSALLYFLSLCMDPIWFRRTFR